METALGGLSCRHRQTELRSALRNKSLSLTAGGKKMLQAILCNSYATVGIGSNVAGLFPMGAMIAGIVLLVLVHEFGHWIVARSFGMWTPVFSIGFGPRKFSWILGRCWNTEFRLSPIPLGGYVSIPELGDETIAKDASDFHGQKRELLNFAIWKRTCVACAG